VTSIWVIDAKFHRNPLLYLRDLFFSKRCQSQIWISNMTQCWDPFVLSLATSSPSSRTVLQPTVPARLLHYCYQRQLTSSAHWSGHQTARILIQQTMWFARFCRSNSTVLLLADGQHRSSERMSDWRVVSLWSSSSSSLQFSEWPK